MHDGLRLLLWRAGHQGRQASRGRVREFLILARVSNPAKVRVRAFSMPPCAGYPLFNATISAVHEACEQVPACIVIKAH